MTIALVTGPSSGIGRATAIKLGRRGLHVVAAGRSAQRTGRVIDEIEAGGGSAEFLELDLASLESTRQSAHRFRESDRTLDVLINNAGIGGGRGTTSDGFEKHFGINHLGHFMLTSLLASRFRPGTRIVQLTSAAHFSVDGIDFDDMQRRTKSLLGWREYGISKLANVLFVRELARRQSDWDAYAVHPGMTDTNIFPRIVKPLLRNKLLTPEQGAETVVWCATSDEVAGKSGRYWRHLESRPPSEVAQDDELAKELWEKSVSWCGASPLD